MHSKWQIWDFFQSYPKSNWKTFSGRIVLQAFDPLALRLMKDHLLHGVSESLRPKQIVGSDGKLEWLESEFLSLSLFGNNDSWLISAPDDLPAVSKEALLREDLLLEDRVLALAFHSDTAYLKKYLKVPGVVHLQLEAPRFWEIPKLIDFLCSFFHLPLTLEAKEYLQGAVDNDFMPLFDSFRLIKLNYPESRQVTQLQVQELVGVDRLDQFALAGELAKKSWVAFFDRLLAIEMDYERLRAIFSFLQSHLLKLADPSYLEAKKRLSQYDQEIQKQASHWRPQEVNELLGQLQHWELLCRTKNPFILTHLRQALLKSQARQRHPVI